MAAGDIYIWNGTEWLLQGTTTPVEPSAYEVAVLEDDPYALYMMAEASAGDPAVDAGPNNVDGEYSNTLLTGDFTPASPGPDGILVSMGFPERDTLDDEARFQAPSGPDITTAEVFTLGLWFRMSAAGRVRALAPANVFLGGIELDLTLEPGEQSLYLAQLDDTSAEIWGVTYVGTDAITDDDWHFLSAVIHHDGAPDIKIDDGALSLTLDTGSHATAGNFESALNTLRFAASATNASGQTNYLLGGYAIVGELSGTRRTAHFEAVDVTP